MNKPIAGAAAPPRGKIYLRLGRVSNLPTVWTNCIAGVVVAGAAPDRFLPLMALSISCFYVGGMFLNDAFDQEFDRTTRPERPIPSGQISARHVYLVGFSLLAAGELLLLLPGWVREQSFDARTAWNGLLLGLLITYYNFTHKRDPLSPVTMALCRAMIYLIAGWATQSALGRNSIAAAAVLAAYITGLSYVAKQENLKEVKNLWPLLLLAAPMIYFFWFQKVVLLSVLAITVLLGWVLFALSFLTMKSIRNVPRAVVSLIAGISLLDAMLVTTAPDGPLWLSLCLSGFVLTLLLQRYVPGT